MLRSRWYARSWTASVANTRRDTSSAALKWAMEQGQSTDPISRPSPPLTLLLLDATSLLAVDVSAIGAMLIVGKKEARRRLLYLNGQVFAFCLLSCCPRFRATPCGVDRLSPSIGSRDSGMADGVCAGSIVGGMANVHETWKCVLPLGMDRVSSHR